MRSWDCKLAGEISASSAPELHLSPAYRFMALSQTSGLPIPREVSRHIHELDSLGRRIDSSDAAGLFDESRPIEMGRYVTVRQSLERFFDGALRFGGAHSENPAGVEELEILWKISSHELHSIDGTQLPDALRALRKDSRFAVCAGEAINDFLTAGKLAAARTLARPQNIAAVADFLAPALADSARLSDTNFNYLVALSARAIRRGYQSVTELSISIQIGLDQSEKTVDRIGSVNRLFDLQTAENRVPASTLSPQLRAALRNEPVSDEVMGRMLHRDIPNSLFPEVSAELAEIVFSRSSTTAKLIAIRLLRRATVLEEQQQESPALRHGMRVFFQRLAESGLPKNKAEAVAVIELLEKTSPSFIRSSARHAGRFCAKEISSPFSLRVWTLLSAWTSELETQDLVTFAVDHIDKLQRNPHDRTRQTNGLMALEILGKIGPKAGAAVPSITQLLGVDWSSVALRDLAPLSKIAPTSAAELGARAVEALAAIGSADKKVQSVFHILTHFSVDPVSRAARKALKT